MKRLFTFAIISLIASLTFAQAPLAKKNAAGNRLERMANLEEVARMAKETKELQAAKAVKDAVPQETASSVLRKSSAKRPFFDSVESTVVKSWTLGGYRSEVSATPYKSSTRKATAQEGNVTVTTDANGIITDVTGVEPKMYQRATTGTAYYNNNGSVNMTSQSGMVTVIEDGDNVYIKDPVTRYTTGAWVKGTKSGNTITVAAKQPLTYSAQYNASVSLRWGVINAAGSIAAADDHAEAITFSVNGNVLTLEGTQKYTGTADAYFIGGFWDDDNSSTGYGDAESVLTYDPTYVAPSTDLVTPPAGTTGTGWYMNCTSVSSSGETAVNNQAVKVAFVGDDIYIQGISDSFTTSWVKGTVNGTSIKFDKFQYVGKYGTSDCWFVGLNATQELSDATATYDAQAKTITFNEAILINAATDRVYYLNWFKDAILSEEAKVIEEPTLTDLTAALPYTNNFDTDEEQGQVAIYDANEDKSTFTFETHTTTSSTVARYRYSTSNNADDYLIFPGVSLKAGAAYKVSVDAAAYGPSYPERLEVVAGKAAKVSQLTIPVIASTDVNTKEFVTLGNNKFTVTEDGTYYIAVHAISDKNMFYLYVDNFSISELDDSAPATVSDLAITADANGANKATVTFTTPGKTVSGTAITENVNVTVKREGTVIFNETKAAGSAVSIDDQVEAAGYYTYSVTASCGEHLGEAATEKVYIGYDTPDVVSNVTIADKSGSVELAWNAPAAGANGYVINPADFTYNIYPVEFMSFLGMTFPVTDYANPYLTGLTETSANVPFDTNSGDHEFTYFAVTTQNTTGESDDVYAAIVTGAPYQMPVFESIASGSLSYWWGYASDNYNQQLEGGLYIGDKASDGDGNCFQMTAKIRGWVNLQSGKIALAGAVNPTLTFDYSADAATPLAVSVITPDGETTITELTAGTDYASATISLADYADKDWVRVIITGTFSAAGNVYLDNIRVYNMLDNNLVAGTITATSRVAAGEDVTVTVNVENQGSNTAEAGSYTVDLYCNDSKVQSLPGTELAKNAKTTFEFTEATNVMTASELIWKAVIEFDADEDKTSNTTATAKTVIKTNNYPAVTDLAGKQTNNGVSLTWSEPDMTSAQAEPVTDDFENYESFAINNAGEWSFIDGDGLKTYAIDGLTFPGAGSEMAYITFDNSGDEFNESFDAHSGNKYLASFASNGGQNNDWMISPELAGVAQTISFFAKTYTAQYGNESFEFYYSTTGKEMTDFIKAGGDETVPDEWTEYTFDVPEGAKYFAIRCTSDDKFIFLVDDVTYIPAGASAGDLSLVGYNVYRDGEKINSEPVEETEYIDADAAEGVHSYVVTVIYDKGESKVSNVVTISVSTGIAGIATKATKVSVNGKTITVADAEGENVGIYTADGKTVYNGAGSAETNVRVENGVYIVRVGRNITKTVVK
ncbi:MAG: hypothetical protein NC116_06695 [Clostridium sp.]|nr:hypothetical protein [Bacteroidales bacterium]MCM1510387.1 hypothetical protein [Clostridium sp.]